MILLMNNRISKEGLDELKTGLAALVFTVLIITLFTETFLICIIFNQNEVLKSQIAELEARKTVIIYQVDNAHGQLIGTVTGKEQIDGHYTVTIGAYGKFLVTREQYDSLNIGDDAPDYLKQRGVASNQPPQ